MSMDLEFNGAISVMVYCLYGRIVHCKPRKNNVHFS